MYNLVSSDVDGSKLGCSDNCAYAMEGDMNMTRKFCFRPGKFESKCDSDFTGMPGGGSMGTGMPGGGGMTTGMPGGGGMTGGAGGKFLHKVCLLWSVNQGTKSYMFSVSEWNYYYWR